MPTKENLENSITSKTFSSQFNDSIEDFPAGGENPADAIIKHAEEFKSYNEALGSLILEELENYKTVMINIGIALDYHVIDMSPFDTFKRYRNDNPGGDYVALVLSNAFKVKDENSTGFLTKNVFEKAVQKTDESFLDFIDTLSEEQAGMIISTDFSQKDLDLPQRNFEESSKGYLRRVLKQGSKILNEITRISAITRIRLGKFIVLKEKYPAAFEVKNINDFLAFAKESRHSSKLSTNYEISIRNDASSGLKNILSRNKKKFFVGIAIVILLILLVLVLKFIGIF